VSGAWRYWTTPDCVRHWAWFPRVGRPERSIFGPCAKAAAVAIPLIVGPAVPYEYYEYASGAGWGRHPGTTPSTPGGWPLAVPGTYPIVPGADLTGVPPVPPAPPAWLEGQGYPPQYLDTISPRETSPVSTDLHPEIVAVPEPGSLIVLSVGAGAAVLVRRRRG
jgi:hypothetical protein